MSKRKTYTDEFKTMIAELVLWIGNPFLDKITPNKKLL